MQSRSAKTSGGQELSFDVSGTAYYRLKREFESVKKQLAEVSGAYSSLKRQMRQQTPPYRDRPRDPAQHSRGGGFAQRPSPLVPSTSAGRRAFEAHSGKRRAQSDTEDRWSDLHRRRGFIERTASPRREASGSPGRRFDPTAYQRQRRESIERSRGGAAGRRNYSHSPQRNESGYASASSQVRYCMLGVFSDEYLLSVVCGVSVPGLRRQQEVEKQHRLPPRACAALKAGG